MQCIRLLCPYLSAPFSHSPGGASPQVCHLIKSIDLPWATEFVRSGYDSFLSAMFSPLNSRGLAAPLKVPSLVHGHGLLRYPT
jgi:hypothetical protein